MKKILKEWRSFLKEAHTSGVTNWSRIKSQIGKDDDQFIADVVALVANHGGTPEMGKYLIANVKRALRIIDEFLSVGSHYEIIDDFEVNGSPDLSLEFDSSKDFAHRLEVLSQLLNSRDFNFELFDSPQSFEGYYNPKDVKHSGGASDTGLEMPKGATDEEIKPIVDAFNDYKSFYQNRDSQLSSKDYRDSLHLLKKGIDKFIKVWRQYDKGSPYIEKLIDLDASIDASLMQGIEKSPQEMAEDHMEKGNKMLEAGLREASTEFSAARRIFMKLGMNQEAAAAKQKFRNARRLR